MRSRPKDFFGPDDWTGGDPSLDEARILKDQQQWDQEFYQLPWWKRFWYGLSGKL